MISISGPKILIPKSEFFLKNHNLKNLHAHYSTLNLQIDLKSRIRLTAHVQNEQLCPLEPLFD
jgi:hypothetical protein